MKNNLDLIFITLFAVAVIIGIVTEIQSIFYLSTVFAITGFLIVQQPTTSKNPDERDRFINHQSSSIAFIVTLIIVTFMSVGVDFIDILQTLRVQDVLQALVAVMYMTYTIAYAVLKRKY